jgi:hypothetical protein
MEKWTTRLPLGEEYERCVSTEWLEECEFIPDQLTTIVAAATTVIATLPSDKKKQTHQQPLGTEQGTVLQLATPNSVLTWKK